MKVRVETWIDLNIGKGENGERKELPSKAGLSEVTYTHTCSLCVCERERERMQFESPSVRSKWQRERERERERVKFRSKGNWIWQLIKQWRRELSCCKATYSFWTCKVRPFIGPRVKYFTSYSGVDCCVSLSFGKSSLMRLPTKQVLKNCSFNGQNKASSVFSLVQKDIGECKWRLQPLPL